jgi:pyruvate kinase
VRVSVPSLTEKDLRDLAFALEQELDYIALSFVRSAGTCATWWTASPKAGRWWW